MEFGLEFIKKLKPCTWKFKPGPLSDGKEHVGLIAQDINEVLKDEDEEYAFVIMKNGFYAINYHEFIGPLIKSIQELKEKVDKLEQENARLYKNCISEIHKDNYPK
jgi:hypothetical protein